MSVVAQVAFRKGEFIQDLFVEAACESFIVHAEIRLHGVSYSAYGDCHPSVRPGRPISCRAPDWVVFDVTLPDDAAAQAFLQTACNSGLAYNFYPWRCVVADPLPRAWETPDVDCNAPATWGSVFCSQLAFLFLKHCLGAEVPAMDSRGVSPIVLYYTVSHMGLRQHVCTPDCAGVPS